MIEKVWTENWGNHYEFNSRVRKRRRWFFRTIIDPFKELFIHNSPFRNITFYMKMRTKETIRNVFDLINVCTHFRFFTSFADCLRRKIITLLCNDTPFVCESKRKISRLQPFNLMMTVWKLEMSIHSNYALLPISCVHSSINIFFSLIS